MAQVETRCTACKAVFEIEEAQLNKEVACVECGETFRARRKLGFKSKNATPEEPPAEKTAAPARHSGPKVAFKSKPGPEPEPPPIVSQAGGPPPPPADAPSKPAPPPPPPPSDDPAQSLMAGDAYASVMDESSLDDTDVSRRCDRSGSITKLLIRLLIIGALGYCGYLGFNHFKAQQDSADAPKQAKKRSVEKVLGDVQRITAIRNSAARRIELRPILAQNDQQLVKALLRDQATARDLADLAALVPTDNARMLALMLDHDDTTTRSKARRALQALRESEALTFVHLYLQGEQLQNFYAQLLTGVQASRTAVIQALRNQLEGKNKVAAASLLWRLGQTNLAHVMLTDAAHATVADFPFVTPAQAQELKGLINRCTPENATPLITLLGAHDVLTADIYADLGQLVNKDSALAAKFVPLLQKAQGSGADALLTYFLKGDADLKRAALPAINAIKTGAQTQLRKAIKETPAVQKYLGKMVSSSIPTGKALAASLQRPQTATNSLGLLARMGTSAQNAIPYVVHAVKQNPKLEAPAAAALARMGPPAGESLDDLLSFCDRLPAGKLALAAIARSGSDASGRAAQIAKLTYTPLAEKAVETLLQIDTNYQTVQPVLEAGAEGKGAAGVSHAAFAFRDGALLQKALASKNPAVRAAVYPWVGKAILAEILPASTLLHAISVESDKSCAAVALSTLQRTACKIDDPSQALSHLASLLPATKLASARAILGLSAPE